MDTSKAAAALGRLGGKAGRGESQRRGDSDHYRAVVAKRWTPRLFLVYRKGANAANQSSPDWTPIAIVRATSSALAVATTWGDARPTIDSCPTLASELVAYSSLTVWQNQSLQAVPESMARPDDWNAILLEHSQD